MDYGLITAGGAFLLAFAKGVFVGIVIERVRISIKWINAHDRPPVGGKSEFRTIAPTLRRRDKAMSDVLDRRPCTTQNERPSR